MTFTPTPEQQAIIDAAGESSASLMVNALAGTAKTTTIELLAPHLRAPSIMALAFNVKIKEELEKRLPKHFIVKTMNGLGHAAWAKASGRKLQLEPQKLGKLITQMGKDQQLEMGKDEWNDIRILVEAARNNGLVPSKFPHRAIMEDTAENWMGLAEGSDLLLNQQHIRFAREVLIESCKLAFQGTIDFTDQIYMSVCYGGAFPRIHTGIVDEAQDLSLMNHIMLRKTFTDRLIVCGDPHQSLYAFRGAATDSMGKIKTLQSQWIDLPLTMTFRCPRSIVARQLPHVPLYRAAPQNIEGTVLDWTENLPHQGETPHWGWQDIPAGGKVAFLCRNNGPLIKQAFRLIRRGIGVQMLGRDLGKGLVTTLLKLGLAPDAKLPEVIIKLTSWKDREEANLRAAEKDSAVERLHDRYESILAVVDASQAEDLSGLISAIEGLFARDKGLVAFATGHRAKGLEWDVVIHLDPWRIPSKYAKSEEDFQQESNINYVIETRSKNTLILANTEDFK